MDRWTDFESEYKLLAYLLVHPPQWRALQARLDPVYFADPGAAEIARVMAQVASAGKGLSAISVMELARKRIDVEFDGLGDLAAAVFSPEDAERLLVSLRSLAQKRRIVQALKGAIEGIGRLDDDADPADVLAKAQTAMLDLFRKGDRQPMRRWDDVVAEVYVEWTEAQDGKAELAYPTGLAGLTSTIGGWRPGRMYVLAARSSMGKSAFAMHDVRMFCQRHGKRAAVFTLEQSGIEIAQRSISAALKIDADLWHRAPWSSEVAEQFRSCLDRVSGWPIGISDDQRLTVDEIKMRARAEKAEYPDLALIVVDHMQEIRLDAPRGATHANALGEAASELRALAQELGVALILLAQLNRSVEGRDNKRPQMSDLRDSGRLEEIADTILLLYREAYYRTMDDPALDSITEIIIGKNRQGGGVGKTVLATFNAPHMTFADAPEVLKRRYWDIRERRLKSA